MDSTLKEQRNVDSTPKQQATTNPNQIVGSQKDISVQVKDESKKSNLRNNDVVVENKGELFNSESAKNANEIVHSDPHVLIDFENESNKSNLTNVGCNDADENTKVSLESNLPKQTSSGHKDARNNNRNEIVGCEEDALVIHIQKDEEKNIVCAEGDQNKKSSFESNSPKENSSVVDDSEMPFQENQVKETSWADDVENVKGSFFFFSFFLCFFFSCFIMHKCFLSFSSCRYSSTKSCHHRRRF